MERNKVHTLVLYALFVGMIFVLALTPIGYITAGPIEITLIHIPVILGSFFLGLRGGLVLGFFFGLSSLLRALLVPTPLSMIMLGADTGFGLYNLLLVLAVIFLPRILVGFVVILFATTGLVNGGIEAVAAVLICTAAGKALQSYMKRRTA